MGMLAKIRRMHHRDGISIREIARRTGLSRNTVREWLRKADIEVPEYRTRQVRWAVDAYESHLRRWVETDYHRSKRERRTAKAMFEGIRAKGYTGSYARVCVRVRQLQSELDQNPKRKAYMPLIFSPGEAFQFDWSCEYAWIAGVRRRLEVSHCKLAHSRAFWMVAYPTQGHEMLFDAHTRSFMAFGGVPRRGIYDNMKTAVDRIGRGKERTVNARFEAMCGHYLFEPEFCTVAAGWEKGIVEKSVLDQRRQIFLEMVDQSWRSLAELNTWLTRRCAQSWETLQHPECRSLTVAQVLAEERRHLMAMTRPFDGYVQKSVRVSPTSLIHFQRNRYSVPTRHAHHMVSLKIYPERLLVMADEGVVAQHARSFGRYRTFYDWQHYIPLLEQKPGALRNGAPFATMPEALQSLQQHLLKHPGGDKVMARVLSTIPIHGLEAVLTATESALKSGRVSGEHVLNVVARLKEPRRMIGNLPEPWPLRVEPLANVSRYEQLRLDPEVTDVP